MDAGHEAGIEIGGYCPWGRKAEDGTIPAKYLLVETNGTLILNVGQLSGGTSFTGKFARKHNEPYLVVQLDKDPNAETKTREWVTANGIRFLNVAGPREARRPGIAPPGGSIPEPGTHGGKVTLA